LAFAGSEGGLTVVPTAAHIPRTPFLSFLSSVFFSRVRIYLFIFNIIILTTAASDFLGFEELLGPEERKWRDKARAFAQTHVAPIVRLSSSFLLGSPEYLIIYLNNNH
jgi:hypothetical protein